MRLELGVRGSVTEKGLELLDSMEAWVVSLSGSGDHSEVLALLVDGAQKLRLSCSAVHDFAIMIDTLSQFESVAAAAAQGSVVLDARTGGVFLHVVSTLRHAFNNLGTDSRTARMLPKVFQDLSRVLFNLKTKNPAPPPAPPVPMADTERLVDEYMQVFLRDEPRMFDEIVELSRRLAADPSTSLLTGTVDTLFRLVHTVKGNAMAMGLEGMASYSHAFEDFLIVVRARPRRVSTETGRLLVKQAETLKSILEDYRRGGPDHVGIESKVAELRIEATRQNFEHRRPLPPPPVQTPRKPAAKVTSTVQTPAGRVSAFLLVVTIAGRKLMIPCEAVAQVLRHPRVLAVPGGRKGWLGVIRAGGQLLPLVDPRALFEGEFNGATFEHPNAPWVVVLSWEGSRLCVPVDEMGEVRELPFGIATEKEQSDAGFTLLDIAGMLENTQAAA